MTWRHTEAEAIGFTFPGDVTGGCIRCLWDDAPEPRHDPTPDPTSPCRECGTNEYGVHSAAEWSHHPYRPTRCTCGHPIEEAPR